MLCFIWALQSISAYFSQQPFRNFQLPRTFSLLLPFLINLPVSICMLFPSNKLPYLCALTALCVSPFTIEIVIFPFHSSVHTTLMRVGTCLVFQVSAIMPTTTASQEKKKRQKDERHGGRKFDEKKILKMTEDKSQGPVEFNWP